MVRHVPHYAWMSGGEEDSKDGLQQLLDIILNTPKKILFVG